MKSDILGKKIKMFISNKARRCIMKAGSLDKYLLTTKPEIIDSKFGLYLRDLIIKKKQNPSMDVGTIFGTVKLKRSRKTNAWSYRQIPTIYRSIQCQLTHDHSKYYQKSLGDMSRHEMSHLRELASLWEDMPSMNDDEFEKSEEY